MGMGMGRDMGRGRGILNHYAKSAFQTFHAEEF